ncbi:MAG: NUDIX domain-containing protein [Caldimicrobium sp.]|nr:NUDIX domain-containing protein [Caldimicrobium sp.]MCX7612648.1 NUDIX domain-containing protein [Caldimicrobium sp.]MDW8182199.1 NUDIX domain-containing protein [Caldimicrobium sp.]
MSERKKRGRKPKESLERIKREPIEVVDEDCQPLGVLARGMIHTSKLFHRSVHVFLFNSKGELYLQRRNPDREENPGLWSSSASGHLSPGEPLSIAAQRELKEELNLKVKLEEVIRVPPCAETNWECVTLFVGKSDKIPKPNPSEISEGRFFSIQELERLSGDSPEIFSPAFLYLWKLYREKISQIANP